MKTPHLTTRVANALRRLRLTLRFDAPSVIDWLSPCELEADDRFIAPLNAAEQFSAFRELEERRRLSALTESSPLRLVVRR